MAEEIKTGVKTDAPGASGSASSAEGSPSKGGEEGKDQMIARLQADRDKYKAERDETREIMASIKAEVEELKALKGAPASPEVPEPTWESPEDARVKKLESELSSLKAREDRREAIQAETSLKSEYLENDAAKAVWPKWSDLQGDLKETAKGFGLKWDELSASRREAVYNKVMRENVSKLIEAGRKTAPSIEDMDISGLPRGGAPKGNGGGSDIKLTDLHKQMAKKLGVSEERYLARVKEKMAAASSLEV